MLRTIVVATLASGMTIGGAMADAPKVWLDTSHGPIILELDPVNAPETTDNFLFHVNEGFYDGTVFHRVIDDFRIQGGTYDTSFHSPDPIAGSVPGEPDNGLAHTAGTISMELLDGDIDSGRSEFFINPVANPHLNGTFTVFGEVMWGMHTVHAIEGLRTGNKQVGEESFVDTPVVPPVIHRAVETDGFPIMPLHTGSWYDSSNSGVGFNVEITNNASTESGPMAVVYWYDFSNGNQIWINGATHFDYGDSSVSIDLITYQGDSEGVDFLNPPPSDQFEDWGTLTIQFDNCNTGRFHYDSPDYGTGELTVTRLTIPDQQSCEGL